MKKFLCAVLAVAMMLSMAAVSFAADYVIDDARTDIALIGTFVYDADKDAMEATADIPALGITVEDNEVNAYGKPVYYLLMSKEAAPYTGTGDLTDSGALAPVSNFKYIEKLKYKVELESGAQIIRGLSIVKKYIDVAAKKDDGVTPYILPGLVYSLNGNTAMESGYYYFAEVKLADMETTSETDVIGTLEVSRKADKKKSIAKIDDVDFDFGFTVFYKNAWTNGTQFETIKTDRVDIEWDTTYAMKFDCDDVVELSFGCPHDGNNEGTFNVDVSGQGKVILKYDTNACEEIAAANPGVDMDFVNFNNVKFNRVGEFVYEMDGIVAAYKVVDHQLVPINGAEFDADSVTFNTRVLESYVFATAELVNPAPAATVA